MTEQKIIFDDWRTIIFATLVALIGYTVMVTVPVLSTALVETLGFTEEQVGRVWGNDSLGFSAGSIISAFTVARLNRQHLVVGGVLLCMAANALCLHVDDYTSMMVLRVAAGIGAGIVTGTAIATLGNSTKPVIAFNVLLVGFAFSSAGQLHIFQQLSLSNIYWFMIGTFAFCAVFVRFLPARPLDEQQLKHQEEIQDHSENWNVPLIMPVLCLVAVCFTYINLGGYFTYIELAALDDGLNDGFIASILTWGSFLTLAGCALAIFSARFGLFKPLIAGLLTLAIVVAMLSGTITNTNFVVSVFIFMSMWTFVYVFQYSMMGYMDRGGSLVALVPAVQSFGQFLGAKPCSVGYRCRSRLRDHVPGQRQHVAGGNVDLRRHDALHAQT